MKVRRKENDLCIGNIIVEGIHKTPIYEYHYEKVSVEIFTYVKLGRRYCSSRLLFLKKAPKE